MPILDHLLIALVPNYTLTGNGGTSITAPIVENDTEVQPGSIFVARRGASFDGHSLIPRAIERGAAAIIGEKPYAEIASMMPETVPYVQIESAQDAIGILAAAYHGYPSRHLTVIGVTGTDGKTTTATLIHAILDAMSGGKAGLISTIRADLGDSEVDTGFHVTTPGAPQVQALLATMVANGMRYAVLEMTSHGLAQGRLKGVEIDAAVLTNVTHEHLDYHETFEAYRDAKARMFTMLVEGRIKQAKTISVINADDENADFFAAFPADRIIRYGMDKPADVRATDVIARPGYTQFVLHLEGKPTAPPITFPLIGVFNVMNALAAIAVTRALGAPRAIIERGLMAVTGVSGRLERIDEGQGFVALVDFAHTPNALRNALLAARSMTADGGRVIAVFGSAGLRDREKRRLMAETAVRFAHFAIITAEDPRTESLDAILETMATAATAAGGVEGGTFVRERDRGRAILRAVTFAKPGDVVIACGKGHEQSMAFGTTEYPWDDRDAMRSALRGAPLGGLPTGE